MKYTVVLVTAGLLALFVDQTEAYGYRGRYYGNRFHPRNFHYGAFSGRRYYDDYRDNHYDDSRHRDSGSHQEDSREDDHDDETIYRFAIGETFGPYEYIDEKTGLHHGFHIDLIKAVCAEAGKRCNYLMDDYSHCWDTDGSVEYPGKGLVGGWYEACVGVYPTQARINNFDFSKPFTKNFKTKLIYGSKADLSSGNAADLTGKTVGFVAGWPMNKGCLARQSDIKGNQPGEYTAKIYESDTTIFAAVQSGEIDVFLGIPEYIPENLEFQIVDPGFYCTKSGTAVMAPYTDIGSHGVLEWWNKAFSKMVANGDFRRLCEQGQKDHGAYGELHCI